MADNTYEWLQKQVRRNLRNTAEGINTLIEEGHITPESTVTRLLEYLKKAGEEPKPPAPACPNCGGIMNGVAHSESPCNEVDARNFSSENC